MKKGVLFQALMNLYKAMGGGWVLEADGLTGTTTDSRKSIHGYTEVARLLEMPREQLLSPIELQAIDGQISPHGVIISEISH